ncbi:MAG: transglycosylase SLT domain-containing protein [Elainella sp. Prado103]|jgi:soluble lytic murein transglycosylase|nr:transglycosylase SLT domain-containing protein [Elainella sp. Prado103]
MLKRKRLFLLTLAGSTLLVLTAGWVSKQAWTGQSQNAAIPSQAISTAPPSEVLALAEVAPADRANRLLELTQQAQTDLDRQRARYLLASDWIEQNQGGQALPLLQGLERDYPVLAAEVLAKRAQAEAATGDRAAAQATWQTLLRDHAESPVVAEALYGLGQTEPQYWDQALAQFPAHPRSIEIAQTRLKQNPKQPQLLMVLARHGVDLEGIESLLNQLKQDYAAQLTPEDWQAIGFAYWENTAYGQAGAAYAKAPPSALNLYRAARGAQLGERLKDAKAGYLALLQAFPNEPETGLALLRLADLADNSAAAIGYLDQAIERFPEQAPEALLAKSKRLQAQNSPDTALQLRETILKQYGNSETAAEMRWEQAELLDQQGDLNGAWAWAKQIIDQNPDSEIAPKASFWIGKWATQLGQQSQAQSAYEYTLSRYPESYYAWRSASLLGWDVGDFSTLRTKLPQVVKQPQRPGLLAGSEAVNELYQLGQDREAHARWQVEFTNRLKPTVAEQFTDGLLRLGMGDNLDGIFMLSSLDWREPAGEKADVKALKQQVGYWQSLYPFPFEAPIKQWSDQRQLNPMLVTALIRQESRFEAQIESVAGALGLMQVMPETGEWVASQIGLKDYNLTNPEDNIKLGTWYLDYTHQEYDNNSLFAVASYNAGPGSVADWIDRFGTSDLDRFVEKIPFPETRGYVESVLGNYWNYLRLYNPEVSQQLAAVSKTHAAIAATKR